MPRPTPPPDAPPIGNALQRELLARLHIDLESDRGWSLASWCEAQGLDAPTLRRVLRALADPLDPAVETLEALPLPELSARLEHGHHAALRAEADALRRAVQDLPVDPTGLAALARRFIDALDVHLAKEAHELLRPIRTGRAAGRRRQMIAAVDAARRTHRRLEEDLEELRTVLRRPGPRPGLRRDLAARFERLHRLLEAELDREHRLYFPRLLAAAR